MASRKRQENPCGDCVNGYCDMNCGPAVDPVKVATEMISNLRINVAKDKARRAAKRTVFEKREAEPAKQCTCPDSQWVGSEVNDSTCELTEEEHEALIVPTPSAPTLEFHELFERSKNDRAIIVGSEVRQVIAAYWLSQVFLGERDEKISKLQKTIEAMGCGLNR